MGNNNCVCNFGLLMFRDAKALQEKAARKAGQRAGGSNMGGGGNNNN